MSTKNLDNLPDRVFVSYVFEESKLKDILISKLPKNITPVTFPKEDPDPSTAVSNGIVEKIRSCKALIYPAGAVKSLWVYFERDYAIRLKMPVYFFDPITMDIIKDEGAPSPLNFTLVVGNESHDMAIELLDWMEKERNFKLQREVVKIRKLKDVAFLSSDLLVEGKPIIWFLDQYLHAIVQLVFDENQMKYDGLPFALQDAGYPPDYLHLASHWESWLSEQSMFVMLSNELKLVTSDDPMTQQYIKSAYVVENHFSRGKAIDLTTAVNYKMNWNRVDDLIVRLTFKVIS